MYPRRDTDVDASLPSLDDYWVPKPSETDEEGYGLNFRDVSALSGVTVADARGVLQWERGAADWVSEHAEDEERFETLARLAESYNPVDGLDDFPSDPLFPVPLQDSDYSLWGLELGVSGLSYVMAATGFYPVASCRSHAHNSWADHPTVLFACDKRRLERLQPIIAQSGCGLNVDSTRGKTLLVVYSPSIVEIMNLAGAAFDARAEFRALPKTIRTRSNGSNGEQQVEQPSLF